MKRRLINLAQEKPKYAVCNKKGITRFLFYQFGPQLMRQPALYCLFTGTNFLFPV